MQIKNLLSADWLNSLRNKSLILSFYYDLFLDLLQISSCLS
ncbi:hypothetical protein LEP1GSC145_2601 [Leptospira interrogans serovar Djasiman str. LT1649]|uniref:Uncharacterized protein n=2 Tax=Leptospira interrogans TaxID=173 RepID=M3HS50_LEPIT|nr:hypothetical protein LEP1GSC067_2109 [Leptospira interrogans serovar Lora str. TE 1992]EMG20776.1 hypothetical protein LEP1GSC150_1240 [Leptospira interrogans serovar Copenhageni str. LT2050]EMM92482.1 hypothetical protein LEP1GSC145_2601 [Leptospira interrogans serovar Djasiman str. LT1649]